MEEIKISFSAIGLGIIVGLIMGIIGYLVSHSVDAFLVGFSMTVILSIMTYLCCIPFVGFILYWILGNQFIDWFLNITQTVQIFAGLKWIPLVLFSIITFIFNIVWTILFFLLILVLIARK